MIKQIHAERVCIDETNSYFEFLVSEPATVRQKFIYIALCLRQYHGARVRTVHYVTGLLEQ